MLESRIALVSDSRQTLKREPGAVATFTAGRGILMRIVWRIVAIVVVPASAGMVVQNHSAVVPERRAAAINVRSSVAAATATGLCRSVSGALQLGPGGIQDRNSAERSAEEASEGGWP